MIKFQVKFLSESQESKLSSLATLTEDDDWSTEYIGVPPLLALFTCNYCYKMTAITAMSGKRYFWSKICKVINFSGLVTVSKWDTDM